MKTHDAIAQLPFCDAGTHGHHGAGNFMPENLRRGDKSVLNLLDIRAANSARRHTNQHFSGADGRHRNVFHNHASLAAVDSCPHRRRDGSRRKRSFENGSRLAHSAATAFRLNGNQPVGKRSRKHIQEICEMPGSRPAIARQGEQRRQSGWPPQHLREDRRRREFDRANRRHFQNRTACRNPQCR